MIIGNGLIARRFKSFIDNQDIVIFASGVSNSQEDRESEYIREEKLLQETLHLHQNKTFIYFSTCSVYDDNLNSTKYVTHKLKMENMIKKKSNGYYIFRLPQVLGSGGNDNNLVNSIYSKVQSGEKFEIWKNATRNLIDIDNIYKIVCCVLDSRMYKNEIVNIASKKNISIESLVKAVELKLNKKAHVNIVLKGSGYDIDISKILKLCKDVDLDNHIVHLLVKYLK